MRGTQADAIGRREAPNAFSSSKRSGPYVAYASDMSGSESRNAACHDGRERH